MQELGILLVSVNLSTAVGFFDCFAAIGHGVETFDIIFLMSDERGISIPCFYLCMLL